MMSSLYYANVTVHVLAAMLWVGGMLFLGLIGVNTLTVHGSAKVVLVRGVTGPGR